MFKEVENPMVLDSHWRNQERHIYHQPAVIGECYGCNEDILASDTWLEMELNGCTYTLHQSEDCCFQFVAGASRICSRDE